MKKKKNKTNKLAVKDHMLYFFSYLILFPFTFPLPIVIYIRNKLFLSTFDVLAVSAGYGLLWTIPTIIITAIFTGYIAICEKRKISFLKAIKEILCNKLKALLMVFMVVCIVLSLSLSILSDRIELRDEQIIQYNIFGMKTKTFDIKYVDKVNLWFDSMYVSNNRYGTNTISLSYCVYIGDDYIEFSYYNIENLILIDQLFVEKPHIITNEFYLNRWLDGLDCNEEIKMNIKKIFAE